MFENDPPKAEADKRVARTREALLDALVGLLIERGYDGFTVQDLLDRSNVGRATFYAHFKSKEDLLKASLGRLRKGIERQCLAARESGDVRLAFSLAFFRHVGSHRRIYYAMIGRKSQATIEHYLRRMLLDLAKTDLQASGSRSRESSRDAAAHYIVGGLWSLLVWWLDSRAPASPEEINAMFLRFTLQGIDADF